MTTTAYQGRGSKLAMSTDGSTYTNIAQLRTIKPAGVTTEFDDISNLDSASAFHEYLATFLNAGEVSFDGVLDPQNATFKSVNSYQQNLTPLYFRVVFPDASNTTLGFQGFISNLVPGDVDFAKAITFSGKLKVTGPITITP